MVVFGAHVHSGCIPFGAAYHFYVKRVHMKGKAKYDKAHKHLDRKARQMGSLGERKHGIHNTLNRLRTLLLARLDCFATHIQDKPI